MILQFWRWRRNVPLKRYLIFNGLQCFMSKKIELLISLIKLLSVNGEIINKRAEEFNFHLTKNKMGGGPGDVSSPLSVFFICVYMYVCIISTRRRQVRFACCLLLFGCLFSLYFDYEDGGSTFFRNVGERLPSYTPFHSRK
jgi:hypothetical protein